MRKTTWRLIPMIGLGYGVAYMDRVNISFASLQMNRDLHFSATVYGLGAGCFFVSYAICEIPSNLLLYRIGARRWLARIMLTWGLLAMAMIFVRTPVEFYAMRFLLGMAEAGFFPGVLYYLTQWFPAELRARTISRFYVSLPLSSVVMGGVAGALLNLQGRLGLAGWQWLFLVEGLPAIVLSAVFLKWLPDGPADAAWLSDVERAWILERLADGNVEPGTHSGGVGAALKDRRVWLFGTLNLLMLGTVYAYTFSAPVILERLTGLNVTRVGFLIAAIGLVGGAAMLGNAWLSDRTGQAYWHVLAPSLVGAVCLLGVSLTVNPYLAVPGLAMMLFAYYAMQGPLLSLPMTFLKGEGAAAGLATINMIGMVGGVLGPSMMGWARDVTGTYLSGLRVMSVAMFVFASIAYGLKNMARRGGAARLDGAVGDAQA